MFGDFTWPYYQQTFWPMPLQNTTKKKETKPTSLKVYILRISFKYLCITQHKIFLVGGYDHNLLGGLFSKCSVDQIEDTRWTQN